MTSWSEIEGAAPEFAARARKLLEAGRHRTLATVRVDGSPRISGIECEFTDNDLRFGSMPDSRKGADLARDPRFALHGTTFHPAEGKENEWTGEAKVSGRARSGGPITVDGSDESMGEWFIADIDSVTITGLNDDGTRLRIEWWSVDDGLQTIERD